MSETLQRKGLMQYQPSIKEPTSMAMAVMGSAPPGATVEDGRIVSQQELAKRKGTMQVPQQPMEKPGQPVTPTLPQVTPPPQIPEAPSPTASNSPGPGMDYLEGVRSREQRGMDRGLAEVSAALKKRGLNTSGIGQSLTNNARADLSQRMQENMSAAAFEDYKLRQQQQHEMNLQNLMGTQKENQIRLGTNETVRGAKEMIPVATQEYQAGIDAYKQNFPQLFQQQQNPLAPSPQLPEQQGPTRLTYQQQQDQLMDMVRASGVDNEARRAQLQAGSSNQSLPQVGPGSFNEPLSAKPGPGSGFGEKGALGPTQPRSPNFTPGPSSAGATTPSSAGVGGAVSGAVSGVNPRAPMNPTPQQQNPAPATWKPPATTGQVVPQFTPSYQPTGGSYKPSVPNLGIPGYGRPV